VTTMGMLNCPLFAAVLCLILMVACGGTAEGEESSPPLRDKTLMAWVSLDDLAQRGGTALTLEDRQGHFDGLVFGELTPGKWMAGSDGFLRTERDQSSWPVETAGPNEVIQIAAVYRGQEVTLYRNGKKMAHYTMQNPPLTIGSAAMVLFGRRHLEAGDKENSFTGRILDARIYAQPLDDAGIAALHPNTIEGGPAPWAWWSFADEGFQEKTGRFTEIRLMGKPYLPHLSGTTRQTLDLFGEGATVVALSTGNEATAPVPAEWGMTGPVPDAAVRSARLLRERLLADPWRPRYHFCVPEDMGEPGDPNGAFYAAGRYHLMYLYNRSGVGFCWGHISSADLVHWQHHPDAIGPGNGDEGCFSGGAFVDSDGSAYLSYWMLGGAKGIGIARSAGPPYDVWTKLPQNPVIHSTEFGITEIKDATGHPLFLGSADPSNIWKENGRYYMLTGNLLVLNKIGRQPDAPLSEQGDRLYLFESQDMKTWTYRHVFYPRRPEWTDRSEDDMCPSFLPLPSRAEGGKASGKHLLLFISHNKGCQYYVGTYQKEGFTPENHGRMTWVDNTYFAPEALIDGKGRQIMWAWLLDNPGGDKEKGWSGVYGLPRTLWLGDDGTLRMRPVPEIETLRGHSLLWRARTLADDRPQPFPGVAGDACEINLEVHPEGAKRVGVLVRRSPDGSEETRLYYDAEKGELVFDSTRSGIAGRKTVERAPLALHPGEPLRLRVFVDRSVVEVYANDRQAICRRVFPGQPNSVGVAFFAEGGKARFAKVKAWEMSPSNPY
jgi:beta-fructofuranosidase